MTYVCICGLFTTVNAYMMNIQIMIFSVENIKTRVYVSIPRYGTCATCSGGAIHTQHSVLCEVIDHS
jgi:hypothetical protein